MTIPSLPPFYDMYYTKSDGRLLPDAYLYNDQLWQALNIAVTLLNTLVTSTITSSNGVPNQIINNGVVMPSKTAAEITALQPNAALGTLWFNTDLAKLQVKTAAGVIETITST